VIKDSADATDAFQPQGVPIEILHTDKTLSTLLEAGELDAMISAHPPECFTRSPSSVKRVIQSDSEAAADYFRRTKIFPILHVMGVRRELLHKRPELAHHLFATFTTAKDLAFEAAKNGKSNSWQNRAFSYGIGEPETSSLDFFLRHHFSQGLADRLLDVADLFAPVPMSWYEH
jgi:4,5-dihydroxyphthalate decarboxylase